MTESAKPDLTIVDIEALTAALAAPSRRDLLLCEVARIAAERIGVVVFSASICRLESMVVERIYSSDLRTYPIGAITTKRETSWGRQVLQMKRVFVGEGHLAMAAAFDDQVNMEKAGVSSIINVPIVVHNKCIAVLNFGFGKDRLAARELVTTRLLALIGTAAFLSTAQ